MKHASIHIRIFNPWRSRETGRGVEFVKNVDRLNTRMHNKVMIADNHAVILGGRNIGDNYFGLSDEYNFRDVDVLGIGPVARQASDMFDEFWNSGWVVSASDLPQEADEEYYDKWLKRLEDSLHSTNSLSEFSVEQQRWMDRLSRLARGMTFARSEFVFDAFEDDQLVEGVARPLDQILKSAESEILLVNAYLIPDQDLVDRIESLTSRGVQVRILTNSLASHDVPAVNSHYQKWRRPVIDAGADLYEFRCDPAIKSRVDTLPMSSQFTALHTKVLVVDRQTVFIGSMNRDPRSANINTETGVIIESPELGVKMAELAIRDTAPENAWQVKLDNEGNLTWENLEEIVTQQPARNPWQRVMDGFFKILPESQI